MTNSFEIKKTNVLSVSLDKVAKFMDEPKREGLNYEASLADWQLSHEIMDRLMRTAKHHGFQVDRKLLHQDLMTAHCNGTPMRLWSLLASGNDDFFHDVLGIGVHIDRSNGRMLNGFTPRLAVPKN